MGALRQVERSERRAACRYHAATAAEDALAVLPQDPRAAVREASFSNGGIMNPLGAQAG